jgi:hypothetical protein
MKQIDSRSRLDIVERAAVGYLCGLCALAVIAGFGGCDTGRPTTEIPNVLQSAPCLPEYDANNSYIPYYQTAEMNTPRYLHEAITHSDGNVWVFGGSDERGLSGLDSVEFYDQSTVDEDRPIPATLSGIWIDTDIEGNPLVLLAGARMLFSVNELGNSDLILVGGSTNLTMGVVHPRAEIVDVTERAFRFAEGDMVLPRFRHIAVTLGNGDLLVIGGQYFTTVTVIDENIPEGFPGRERRETRYPSTESVEFYSPMDDAFFSLTVTDDPALVSTLQTRRGRADHAAARLAGPDNLLGGSDDMFIVTAGKQTLSAVSGLAPNNKFPETPTYDSQTSIEVFDPVTNLFTLITSVKLDAARLDRPYAVNLGEFNDRTPDGVLGMGNSFLVTHGNQGGNTCPTTWWIDQVFIASFNPGAGPAQGVRFYEQREDQYLSYMQHAEYPALVFPQRGVQVGRCATNPVPMPHRIEPLVQGASPLQTWVFSLAGVDIYPVPGGCVFNHDSAAMLAGCVFDPFYNRAVALNTGVSPRDLATVRRASPRNFLGIVGVWFTLDGFIDATLQSWGTSANNIAVNRGGARAYVVCAPVAGVDGRLGSLDDRILLTGGGREYNLTGGEPTSPSAEVFVPPGAGCEED